MTELLQLITDKIENINIDIDIKISNLKGYKNPNNTFTFLNKEEFKFINSLNVNIIKLSGYLGQINFQLNKQNNFPKGNILQLSPILGLIKKIKNYHDEFMIFYSIEKDNNKLLTKYYINLYILKTIIFLEIVKRELKLLNISKILLEYILSEDTDNKLLVTNIYSIIHLFLESANIGGIFTPNKLNIYNKNINEIGKNDIVTFLEIIFSINNINAYTLRFDIGHKGEDYIHVNLDGYKEIGGLPIYKSLFTDIINKIGVNNISDLGDLVYEDDFNKIWFTPNFEIKLKNKNFDKGVEKQLLDLFKQQSHFKVLDTTQNKNDNLDIIINDLICKFSQIKDGTITKEGVENEEEVRYKSKLLVISYNLLDTYFKLILLNDIKLGLANNDNLIKSYKEIIINIINDSNILKEKIETDIIEIVDIYDLFQYLYTDIIMNN